MADWEDLIRDVADDPSEYERDGTSILFSRQGRDHSITVKDFVGTGICVDYGNGQYVQVERYVQDKILELPRLAGQLVKALEKMPWRKRGIFIQGPAKYTHKGTEMRWERAGQDFKTELFESDPDSTRLIQLMAAAGKGKTILLENTAIEFAHDYTPKQYPSPILLPIDLVGRYVGAIEDAIAGSLTNTYLIPGLTQRDIILCIRKKWIILALDGFDELVARVGIRDAFLRISELLDQLRGNGTVILSARESFFDLYEITSGIRLYLQPTRGNYDSYIIRLSDWSEKQGVEVFQGLGSADPQAALRDLSAAFDKDESLVYHPFFLTRLAELWTKGERFSDATGKPNTQARTRYIVETFIRRESGEKWLDPDGKPLLSHENHLQMLSWLAEEMWRSGAHSLDIGELMIATEMALTELGLTNAVISQVTDRIPTHAALALRGKRYSFLHDRFFHFFLGKRISSHLSNQRADLSRVLDSRELAPEIVDWALSEIRMGPDVLLRLLAFLQDLMHSQSDDIGRINIALLAARLLSFDMPRGELFLDAIVFGGQALRERRYSGLIFRNCGFVQADMSGTQFVSCQFHGCSLRDLLLNEETSFQQCTFSDCQFERIELAGKGSFYDPADIAQQLGFKGATVVATSKPSTERVKVRRDYVEYLEDMIRASGRTWDVAIEEIVDDEKIRKHIIRVGEKHQVLKQIDKQTSGPHMIFVRFTVDRSLLLAGQYKVTNNASIDGFWNEVREKYS